MRIKSLSLVAIALSTLFSSCQTNTGTGVLAGGAVGAGAGALIGGGQGALIGGAIGVIGGGLIGAAMDEQERATLQNNSPRTMKRVDNGDALTVDDIINLRNAGLSDDKIIDLIDKTQSTYALTTSSIKKLRDAGVSDRVINYMLKT